MCVEIIIVIHPFNLVLRLWRFGESGVLLFLVLLYELRFSILNRFSIRRFCWANVFFFWYFISILNILFFSKYMLCNVFYTLWHCSFCSLLLIIIRSLFCHDFKYKTVRAEIEHLYCLYLFIMHCFLSSGRIFDHLYALVVVLFNFRSCQQQSWSSMVEAWWDGKFVGSFSFFLPVKSSILILNIYSTQNSFLICIARPAVVDGSHALNS